MSSSRSRRDIQAAETRQLILRSALKLFTSQGYGATSVSDIAAAAGVAVPTIYTSVGPKPELLRRLLDLVDEQADIPQLVGQLRASDDPSEVLALQVRITRQLAERCGDILTALASAAQVDPKMAETYAAGMQRSRDGARSTTERIEQLHGLSSDVTVEQATALIATLTLPEVWTSLCGTFGWSFDAAEEWIVNTLRGQVLGTG